MYIKSMLLGLIQGLTEFLPVSSSGHLAIFKRILGTSAVDFPLAFDILLHLGTLLAVFVVFRKDIWQLIREFFLMIGDLFRGKPDFKTPYRRFVIMIIVGTIPAVIAGLFLNSYIERITDGHLWIVGVCLFITAFILYISEKISCKDIDESNASYRSSFCVGLFQAFALLPGISRSGSTIAGSLVSGYKKDFAVKFSFILSIPAILGAAVLDLKDLAIDSAFTSSLIPAVLGALIAFVSGFIAIKFLLRLVKNNKLHIFSYYCIFAGIVTIILNFI